MDALLTVYDLAELLGRRVVWITEQRRRGWGPPYVRIGRAVRYLREDVDAWLQAQRRAADHTASTPRT